MNTKFFIAVLTASAVAFFGGWLIFGMLLPGFYEANTNIAAKTLIKDPMEIWAIAIGNISWSFLLTWILYKMEITTFWKGFAASLWVSFLIILTFDLSIYAFWDIYKIGFLFTDIIVSSIFWGFVGAIAAAVLNTKEKVVVVTP